MMSYLAEHPMVILWLWLGLANCVLFVLMGVDKAKAVMGARRIPEATLFLFAVLGGAVGGFMGMGVFRHKTRHKSFCIGFPLLALGWICLTVWLIARFSF